LLGLSHIRLATEGELLEVFEDCEPGAMPPFGDLFSMPVLVDHAVAAEKMIAFNAGTHRDSIHLKFSDFDTLVHPLIGTVAVKEKVTADM
jgi:Ala-tRNA(Pro) deacylase